MINCLNYYYNTTADKNFCEKRSYFNALIEKRIIKINKFHINTKICFIAECIGEELKSGKILN